MSQESIEREKDLRIMDCHSCGNRWTQPRNSDWECPRCGSLCTSVLGFRSSVSERSERPLESAG
jgi:predicted RNA-binding Zn-ribbon protein involved in translation (DUF1610 family)